MASKIATEQTLQAVATALGGLDTNSLAALLTTLNGYIAELKTYTDGIEGKLDTLAGYVDGLEGMLGAFTRVSSASITALASSAVSAQLLAANAARRGLLLVNTDANPVYVKFGETAALTDFTVPIPAGGYFELPQPIYTGRLDAIWAADGAGSLYATEL